MRPERRLEGAAVERAPWRCVSPQDEHCRSGRPSSDAIHEASSEYAVQPFAVRPTARAAWSHAQARSAEWRTG
jgi:hypothetical protein